MTTLVSNLPVTQRNTPSIFDRFFNEFVNRPWDATEPVATNGWRPVVDAFVSDNGVNFVVDLPGVSKDDLQLSVENNILTLSGERDRGWDHEASSGSRAERAFGKFQRSFALPQSVDANKVEATLENGVLNIFVPKAEEAKPKTINIK